jgi:hypothetical protein
LDGLLAVDFDIDIAACNQLTACRKNDHNQGDYHGREHANAKENSCKHLSLLPLFEAN